MMVAYGNETENCDVMVDSRSALAKSKSLGPSRRGAFLDLYVLYSSSSFSSSPAHFQYLLKLLLAKVKNADRQDWYIFLVNLQNVLLNSDFLPLREGAF